MHTVNESYVHILFASVQRLLAPQPVMFAFVPSSGACMQLAVGVDVQLTADHDFSVAGLMEQNGLEDN